MINADYNDDSHPDSVKKHANLSTRMASTWDRWVHELVAQGPGRTEKLSHTG